MTTFKEIWTEEIRRTCVQLAETEVIRYTRPDRRTAVWAQFIILETLMPSSDGNQLTVYGITEDGNRVSDDYTEEIDDYPQEIAALLPELTKAARPS